MHFDSNWAALFTIGLSLLFGVHRPIRRRIFTGTWFTPTAYLVRDALNFVALVPFFIIIGSVFSPGLTAALAELKAYVGLGGAIGLLAIVGEMLKER
jgi:hypothetical protein